MKRPAKFADIWDDVIAACGNHADRTSDQNQKREYMEAGATLFAELNGPLQEQYISQMERLLSGNNNDYQLYRTLWTQIKADTDTDRKEAIAGDVREEVALAISQNQHPNQIAPLIEILQELIGHTGETNGQRIMERLSKQLTENTLNANQKAEVIEQLAGFSNFFEKEKQILDRLENLLTQTNHNVVIQNASALLDQLAEVGTINPDRIGKIKENHLGQ